MTRQTMMRAAVTLLAGGALALLATLLGPAGPASAVTCPSACDLWAKAGSTTMPGGQVVTVWGYASAAGDPVTRPGGPTLEVTEGETVTITLHNELTEATSLLVQGQQMVPDRTGAANGAQKSYTFTAGDPGTYLYEAGLVANGQHQVAMGLYGALVVHPTGAPGQAYADAGSAFDKDAVLVLSELDPALNNTPNPALFDMRKYAPRYFLVNGKTHPDTDPILAAAGDRVLLRYVNAGIGYHSMAVLGARQRLLALDGSPLGFSRSYVAETFGPGQTADAIVTAPSRPATTSLPVYDGSLLLHNTNLAGAGGMLTSIKVTGTGPAADTTGPATRAVTYTAPDLSATVDDSANGGSGVAAAEYFLDTVGDPGTGAAMGVTPGTGPVQVTATAAVTSGEHILYVRGKDSSGNWGPLSSVLVNGGDAGGPTTTSPTLTPRLTNGVAQAVAVSATGDDTASGGSTIKAGEFFVGTVGTDGTGTPMLANADAPVASIDGTIEAAVVNALAEGTHVVSIHSQDAQGNWGDVVTVNLVVDKTGPATSGVLVEPSPNNGTLSYTSGVPAVRVSAMLSDPVAGTVNSTIKAGEVFLETAGADGSGIPMVSGDGVFNDASENGYADIPLATVQALTNGPHTVYVHAKDAAGNWGPRQQQTLVIDKVKPTVSGVSAAPNPTLGATTVTLTGTATDAATAVTRAEWFRGSDPGPGNATAMTVSGTGPWTVSSSINVAGWNEGTHTITVRARDAAGNWSAPVTTTLAVRGPLFFSTVGNTNPPGVGGTADDADVYGWDASSFSREFDASLAGVPGGANVDGYDRVSATRFYVSFADNVTIALPGPDLSVQDEDVVLYDAGTWSVFFDGTGHGLTAGNLDLDAISVAGSTVYFSTVGNTNPPGVGGTADDADVYSWNGTSYARVWDASANGVPGAANVDGFARVDATHFYLSFAADTTLPVLGAVQDEDVVFNNDGAWSVYFDGTAHGLGASGALDVDAFDVP
jgi:FtsP/CotA-like multicopper oxidase with cupredoxin domain